MAIPNATRQEASNAVAALGTYISLHTDAAGTTGDNEASGGSYAREQTTWTDMGTGTNRGSQVQIFCPQGTYEEGGIFSTSSGVTVSAPTDLQVSSQSSGGSFATGTYYWVVTAINWRGETIASSEASAELTGPSASASLTWVNPAGSQGTRIYRGTSSGNHDVLVAEVGPGVGSYSDTGSAGSAGEPPNQNSAYTFVGSNAFSGGEVQVSGSGASIFVTPSITI